MKLKERENQLEMWYTEFKDLPQLSFYEAKQLLKRLDSHEITEVERKSIRDSIITGTLKQIYKYIKNSGLLLLNSSIYEIDDMISASYNVIIEEIENNKFISNNLNFAHYFGPAFMNRMFEKLEISKISSRQVCKLDNNQLAKTLKWYIQEQEIENHPSISDIQSYIVNNFDILPELEGKDLTTIAYLLRQIYTRSFKDEIASTEISENKLATIIPLLIESVIHDKTREIESENVEGPEEIIQSCMMTEYITNQIVNSNELTNKQKDILKAYYGIDQLPKNLTEIAKAEGMLPATISSRHKSALKTLRKSKKVQKLSKEL